MSDAAHGGPRVVAPACTTSARRAGNRVGTPLARATRCCLSPVGIVPVGKVLVGIVLVFGATLLGAAPASGASGEPPGAAEPSPGPTRALFLGNSYTAANDLPARVRALAKASGRELVVRRITPGGRRLHEHAADPRVREALAEGWDVVVLQEQSLTPVVPGGLESWTLPAARTLAASIRGADAEPMLFMTWGRRDPANEPQLRGAFATFAAMQDALRDSYRQVGRDPGVRARVAEVGEAWRRARTEEPAVALWVKDGSHPSVAGTYLAACVFFEALFGESPEGLPHPPSLAPALALRLQAQAAAAAR